MDSPRKLQIEADLQVSLEGSIRIEEGAGFSNTSSAITTVIGISQSTT